MMKYLGCGFAALIALGVVFGDRSGNTIAAKPQPHVLIGYGCNGETGPILRNSESDFPACRKIEPYVPQPQTTKIPVVVVVVGL